METPLLRLRLVLAAMAVGYGVIFLLCVGMVVHMRHHRSGALRGDSRAARKLLLPAFQPLLWLLTVASFLFTVTIALLLALVPGYETGGSFKAEMYYSGRVFVLAVPVLYLRQQAVTTRALIRASLLSLLLAMYNIPIVWVGDLTPYKATTHYVTMATGLVPLVVLSWMCLRPSDRASRRTLREYTAFVWVYYILRVVYSQLLYVGVDVQNAPSKVCDASFTVCLASVFWGSLCPAVVWRVLKADTDHWRGLGRRAVQLQLLFREKHNYLHERVSSRGLHVLIEMHRKHIIDFAYLELQRKIGSGASAVVFQGILHSKIPVAIKVYTPRVLCEETVAEFSHEAALCGALHHPNVVRFYGMCVCPPTVCLVSELCQGSLEDVTRASARQRLQRRRNLEARGVNYQDHLQQRQQLLIDLNYMIDATRAVVYLHSFSPAFLHRDLKPSNFVIDAQGTCKLTDFGESRTVPTGDKSDRFKIQTGGFSTTTATTTSTTATGISTESSYVGIQTPTQPTFVPPPVALRPSLRDRGRSAMTVRGTADYMAPELIEGKAGTAVYGEAADIYSLAITLWDIANPLGSKYPEANRSHLQVFDSVLVGERPTLSPSMHPELRRLLTEAWHQQPERRPSATYILTALETLQQEVGAHTALSLAAAVEVNEEPCTVSGHLLVQHMLKLGFVDSMGEACRVGNSLMSTGFLHHVHHQESFRKPAEQFYFDTDVLDVYAPATPDENVFLSQNSPSSLCAVDELTPLASSHRKKSKSQQRRATDSSVTARCFTPPSTRKTRSSTTACQRISSTSSVPDCACRQLGRGVDIHDRGQRRRFRRNKKWFSIMEESITTENVSTDIGSMPSLDETDEFEGYAISGNWEDMESGTTAAVLGDEVLDEDLEVGNDRFDETDVVHFEGVLGSPRSSIVII
ncbi:hypothetical protein PHYBOEH_002889 [Phytophthora boehmeriae]|uniref:Protein kinase domain-containing protein n=1 Tax=Phytophthora boehmeriae TaxID=109152 RepID=A0A8T1WQ34_9STRA|nr:hypothetical protein PHYBOEH_002889 [Phytophthora boehmeriae]